MMHWSWPDILNDDQETSKFTEEANPVHYKALHKIYKYCIDTPHKELVLQPKRIYDCENKNFLFQIRGKGDSEYAKDQAA